MEQILLGDYAEEPDEIQTTKNRTNYRLSKQKNWS